MKLAKHNTVMYNVESSFVGTQQFVVRVIIDGCKCQHQISLHPNLTQLVADQTETQT